MPPAPGDVDRTPDLLISAFHPSSWHSLFRLTIELKDEPEVFLNVVHLLRDKVAGFNILSTQCAPSGYKHATWNIIGEALDEQVDLAENLGIAIKQFKPEVSALEPDNREFRRLLTKMVSGRMLKYGYELEKLIMHANEVAKYEDKFLLERINREDTLLYLFDDDLGWFAMNLLRTCKTKMITERV